MKYLKLIAIEAGDFCSSIFYEDNYSLWDFDIANKQKKELEEKRYICILFVMETSIRILNK